MFGLIIMRKSAFAKIIKDVVEKTARNCYNIGYAMAKAEQANQGIITGGLRRDIERILKEKGL